MTPIVACGKSAILPSLFNVALSTAPAVRAGDALVRGRNDEAYRHRLIAAVRANRHMAGVLALLQPGGIDCNVQARGVTRNLLRRDSQARSIGLSLPAQGALSTIANL